MMIRNARVTDTEDVASVEAACFPPGTAAEIDQIRERIMLWPDHFWLLFHDGILVSFVDGMATDEKDLTDEMFAHAGMHRSNGAWQMIFGVCTLPEYRNRGFAGTVLNRVIEDSKIRNRKGIVLTCRDHMVPFYQRFGFIDEGASGSQHGGVRWIQMRRML